MRIINGIDTDIAMILQRNARTSNAEIARQVGLAPSAVFERIRKLEEKGVLKGFRGEVDPHAAGLPLLAFVFVRSSERAGSVQTAEKIAQIPEVVWASLRLCHLARSRHVDGLAEGVQGGRCRDRVSVFDHAAEMELDGFAHIALDFLDCASRRNAPWKVGAIS